MIRKWLWKLLGIEALAEVQATHTERLEQIARHFVTKRDPATQQPMETLADQHAEQDGRPKPGPIRGRRNWDQTRRFLEAQSAAKAATKQKRPV